MSSLLALSTPALRWLKSKLCEDFPITRIRSQLFGERMLIGCYHLSCMHDSILPPDQARAARDLWEEFEEGATSEARFAHAMDNLQPVLLNLANEGDDWREHGVFRSQVDQRQAQTRLGSQELWEYVQSQLDRAVEAGWLKTGDLPSEGECS